MVINSERLQSLRRNFRTLSALGYERSAPRWPRVAMFAPSTTGENVYGWIKDMPGMREWVGSRVAQNIGEGDYTIKNRSFESTVTVKREHIEDDTLGIYSPMFEALGSNVAYSPDQLVFSLLPAGFNTPCWDGVNFFANNHPIKKGVTFSNRGTNKLAANRFEAALAAMQSLRNEADVPLRRFLGEGEQAPLLVVGPTNRVNALGIVGVEKLAGGADNPNYRAANIMVLPELTGNNADMWFLLEVSQVVKPLIFQRRKEPEFVALHRIDDPNVFDRSEYRYGYDDRKAAGYGFPQLAWGSTGADPA
jgi:phage major head subunit gpT-like protein